MAAWIFFDIETCDIREAQNAMVQPYFEKKAKRSSQATLKISNKKSKNG